MKIFNDLISPCQAEFSAWLLLASKVDSLCHGYFIHMNQNFCLRHSNPSVVFWLDLG